MSNVRKTEVEPDLPARAGIDRVDYADAFEVDVDGSLPTAPAWWRERLLADGGPVIRAAMAARNAVARRVGLVAGELADLPVLHASETETITGLDDSHLDFRLAIAVTPGTATHRVCATTLVTLHGWRGRLYFTPVRPVHRWLVMPGMMRRAANARAPGDGFVSGS